MKVQSAYCISVQMPRL